MKLRKIEKITLLIINVVSDWKNLNADKKEVGNKNPANLSLLRMILIIFIAIF